MNKPKKPTRADFETEGQYKAAVKRYHFDLYRWNLENNPNRLEGESDKSYAFRKKQFSKKAEGNNNFLMNKYGEWMNYRDGLPNESIQDKFGNAVLDIISAPLDVSHNLAERINGTREFQSEDEQIDKNWDLLDSGSNMVPVGKIVKGAKVAGKTGFNLLKRKKNMAQATLDMASEYLNPILGEILSNEMFDFLKKPSSNSAVDGCGGPGQPPCDEKYFEIIRNSRQGLVNKNSDGTVSTHRMTHQPNPNGDGTFVSFPTLFLNEDKSWEDLNPKQYIEEDDYKGERGWGQAYDRAIRDDEIYTFKTEEEAKKFAVDGIWKNNKYSTGGVVNNNSIMDINNLFNDPKKPEKPEESTVSIKSGDTLGDLAASTGMTVEELASLNNIQDVNKIYAGQELRIKKTPGLSENTFYPEKTVEEELSFNEAFKQAREQLGPNHIFEFQGRKFGTNVEGEKFEPSKEVLLENDLKPSKTKERLTEKNKEVKSPYTSTETVKLEPEFTPWDKVKEKQKEFNKMSQADRIVKFNKDNHPDKQYLIVDESTGRMHLYRGGKKEESFEIITGKNAGDAQTVTKVIDPNKDGKITSEEAKIAEADWSAGNQSTGAGKYTISNINPKSAKYYNSPLFNMVNENGIEVATSIHGTPYSRRKTYGDGDDTNNNMSYGCINGKCADLKKLYEDYNLTNGDEVYILPEDKGNEFILENGQLNFKTKDASAYETYTDEKGKKQKGQGINQTVNTLNHKKISFDFDQDKFEDEIFTYTDLNDQKEMEETVIPYISGLEDSKQKVMQLAGVNGDIYNEIAKVAFGVMGVESNFGDTNRLDVNMIKGAVRKGGEVLNDLFGTNFTKRAGPDTRFESLVREGSENKHWNSLGLTQVVWNQLSKQEVAKLKEMGISKIEDFNNPTKAAAGTALILALRYNNEIKGRENFKDVPIEEALATRWNKGKDYTKRVIDAQRFVKLNQLQ